MVPVLQPSVEGTNLCESTKSATIQSLDILKTIAGYTLNGGILWSVNYVSIKLFL